MKHVHFLGIAGSGASAIANIAKEVGFKVTGCDKSLDSEFKAELNSIHVEEGHSPVHLEGAQILAVTPAIFSFDPDNEEVKEARKQGLEVLTWQQFLGKYLCKDKFVIAVCGTHGKSTTTAMVGQMLIDARLDPTVELGAIVRSWGKNYRIGKSQYFVLEADEFNNNFLYFEPEVTVLTNIEFDHPEFFKDLEDVKESYIKFLSKVKKVIVANMADQNVAEIIKIVTKNSLVKVADFIKNEAHLVMQILGHHNLDNANAALQVGLTLGIEPKVIRDSLTNFNGLSRRLEYLGETSGATIYSDFAHHPSEIKVSAQALRREYQHKNIWVIFEPHMFSRTKGLFKEFVGVFKNLEEANGAIIVDIYPSREKDPGDISSKDIVEKVADPNIKYRSKVEQAWEEIKGELSENDVVVFMGAGPIDKFARRVVEDLHGKT